MTISDVAIERPVFTTMVSVGIVVLGIMGLTRLGVNLFPDVQFPVVTITTVYPGASPSEIETQVTEKIEDSVVSIAGVDQLRSYSSEGVSNVVVLFELDVDAVESATQVRERVAQVRALLPHDAEAPSVARLDIAAAPIMLYTLRGGEDVQTLRRFARDELKPALEQLEGVASINVKGGRDRQINVLVDLDAVQSLGLTPVSIADRIGMENVTIPGGGFDEGERRISVRTLGQLRSVDELRELPVGTGPGGSLVRLRDVATVEDGFEDETTLVRSNGTPAVVFEVQKTSGANTVEVAELVRARLAELDMPEGVTAGVILDQSDFIVENAHEVEVALLFGGAMAILVILIFLLDLRSTFISGLALPTSVLGAFFLMWVLDFTLNMMTLLGLTLAIGLLIDDSIVVRENIMKHLERGEDPFTAARKGTKEITLAVVATTATLCAVFVPIAFTGGMVGQFFREFGLTVAGATIISTWVAFTLDPMLSARLAKKRDPNDTRHEAEKGPFAFITRPMLRFYEAMDALYSAFLRWILSRRLTMALGMLLAFGTLFASFALVPLMGNDFASPEDRGMFNVDIELPAGTRLEETSSRSAPAEDELLQDDRFVTLYAQSGVSGRSNRITWRVVTVPKTAREVTIWALQERAREVIRHHMPEADISVTDPAIVEGARDYPIQIDVAGDDFASLEWSADHIRQILATIPGTKDVDMQYSPGSPELGVRVDRDRASQLGVPLASIARTVRTSLAGEVAGVYREGDDELDIRVRLRPEDRADAQRIAGLRLQTAGGFVPLSDIATVERSETPAEIQRSGRHRIITVTAAPDGRSLGDIVSEFERRIAAEDLPRGVTWSLEGQAKMMNESNASMGLAMLLGLVFIYIVLASQFESYIHPITIMMALPLAIVGAIVALFLQGSTLSMGAMIGIILLMGLVTKNGILLVDHAVERVREGWDPHRAILHAGPARLRPILMTSAAMVLGMLPTALNDGPGSEFRSPMAMGVIGGVISSTFLTLIVVPIFYLAMESLRRWFARWVMGKPTPWPKGHPLAPHAAPLEGPPTDLAEPAAEE